MKASTTAAIPRVAVSYAWKEERVGSNREAVERFCATLRDSGVEVVRDKDVVQPGQNLVAFMQSLAAEDHICVFLTESYLKSSDCMFELLTAWELSTKDSARFAERVHIWQMEGCPEFKTLQQREPLVEWWLAFLSKEKKAARPRRSGPQIDPGTQRYLNQLEDIFNRLHALLTHFKVHLLPRNQDDLLRCVFPNGMPDGPPAPPAEPPLNPGDVFQSVLDDIDKSLADDAAVAAWFAKVEPALFSGAAGNGNGLVRISRGSLNAGTLPEGRVRDIFFAVEDALKQWSPSASQAKLVLKICGQLVVLAMSPSWVVLQRRLAAESLAQVPGAGVQIELGPDPENMLSTRTANFLHIVTVAIAGGGADLQTLFSDHANDGRYVMPPPMKSTDIGDAAEIRALQRCLIRGVLGPKVEIPEGGTQEDLARLRDLLDQARAVAKHFLERFRKPFYSVGDSWKNWQETFNRTRPELPQMVLLAQADGSPAEAFPEYAATLLILCDIHQLLKQRISIR